MKLTEHQTKLFWGGVRKGGPDECWPWRTGRPAVFSFRENGVQFAPPVARVAWILEHGGPIASDAVVRHNGPTASCCNMAHYYLDEPSERTVNTYVLQERNSVKGVRTTLPAAIRLADQADDIEWSSWEESVTGDHVRTWIRRSPTGDVVQRIEMHQTGDLS